MRSEKKLDQLVHIHNEGILDKSLKGLRESVIVILNLFLASDGDLPDDRRRLARRPPGTRPAIVGDSPGDRRGSSSR
jgi:hypothetical protein